MSTGKSIDPVTTAQIVGADPTRPERRLGKGELERVLLAQLLDEARRIAATTTDVAARLSQRSVNSVLDVQTQVFPQLADDLPYLALRYGAAAGAIRVRNHSAAGVVTVHFAGPVNGAPPTKGVGVYRIPPGFGETISCDSHQITLYGTAGDAVSWQVWTTGAAPGA